MKEKTKIKIIKVFCIISILVTAFCIQRTYARYFEKVDTTYNTNIKKWVINVNGKNIHNEETLEQIMTPEFFYNEHMNTNNTLVPGRIGCFDFTIDYTNVDIAFDFKLSVEQLNTTQLTDFEIYAYKVVEPDFEITETTAIDDLGEITTLTANAAGEYELEEINPEEETNKQKRILVIFRWNDMEQNTMDNQADTDFARTETSVNYKVKITFTQTV